jgi:hypothetical protein
MLTYRAWEIKTLRTDSATPSRKLVPEIYFRHLERIMLHLAKHIIQSIVLIIVKSWFIISTKIKKWAGNNWPKVYKFFTKKTQSAENQKPSFVQRAVLESKVKIRRIKEKVKKDHA